MPSSSDQQRNLMIKWFGSIDTYGPESFLKSRGYELTRGWEWVPPVLAYTVSREEEECIVFLVQEWDYGGLTDDWEGVSLYAKDEEMLRLLGAQIKHGVH